MFPVMAKSIADAVLSVGASVEDPATENQHRRSGHSIRMGTQFAHGQSISRQSFGGGLL